MNGTSVSGLVKEVLDGYQQAVVGQAISMHGLTPNNFDILEIMLSTKADQVTLYMEKAVETHRQEQGKRPFYATAQLHQRHPKLYNTMRQAMREKTEYQLS